MNPLKIDENMIITFYFFIKVPILVQIKHFQVMHMPQCALLILMHLLHYDDYECEITPLPV